MKGVQKVDIEGHCWKTKINHFSITEYKLWRNNGVNGPNAFHLQETMLKSDKIRCAYSIVNCVSL